MNTEINKSFQLPEFEFQKDKMTLILRNYLCILKESVEKMNNMNYVNQFLNFSMIQLCNNIGLADHQLILGTMQKIFNNTINISEGMQTICVIDNLIKNFEFQDASTNSSASEKNQKLFASQEAPREDPQYQSRPTEFKEENSAQQAPTVEKLAKINFDHLPQFFIGKFSCKLRTRKILKYKLNIHNHRKNIPIIRKFKGRSEIAKNKLRIKGRFVKQKIRKIFSVL